MGLRRLRAIGVAALAMVPLGPARGQDPPPPPAPAPPDEIVDAVRGYRIAKPAAPWVVAEPTPPPGVAHERKFMRAEGRHSATVSIYVSRVAAVLDVVATRDGLLERWKSDPEAHDLRAEEATLAGGPVPALRLRWTGAGGPFLVRQLCRLEGEICVVVQTAVSEGADALARDVDALLATFAPLTAAAPAESAEDARLRALAERCGSEISWAADWADAAARARRDRRPVLVVFELYRGFRLPRLTPSTTFMDRDVVELCRERLVCLAWRDGMDAPFLRPELYGLGRSTFGQGALFADADGRVLGQVVSMDPFHVYARAREILTRWTADPAPADADVATLIRRGELDAALRRVTPARSPADLVHHADIFRRQRRGAEALETLGHLQSFLPHFERTRGVVLLRLGRTLEAEQSLTRAAGTGRDDPEARYWLACARGMRLGLEPIRAELLALTREHPDAPWAWRAAAMLRGQGLLYGIEKLAWADPKAFAATDEPPYATADGAGAAVRDGVAFLLGSQLPDGTWPSPMSLGQPTGAVATAVTAIASLGLLPHRSRPEVADALARALAVVVRHDPAAEHAGTFDYSVWARIFGLRLLAAAAAAGLDERPRLLARIASYVAALELTQHASGGWAYVRLAGATQPSDNGIGFVTAAALRALHEAAAVGATVAPETRSRALGLLALLRQPGGAFGYLRLAGPASPRVEAEAAVRSPLYASVLREGGGVDVGSVEAALDCYLRHRDHIRAERGKALCHTGPEGTASYYLLFGYAFAAEALTALPPERRGAYRSALRADVLAMRTADGAFCDNPGVGRAYGTGMALHALGLLAE